MKKFLLGAAAVMAVAAPGAAAAQSGYVGGLYANADAGTPAGDQDAWGAEGAVFFDAGSLGAELDANVVDGDDTDTAYGVTGHLFTRNDNYLFGGFASVADSDDSTTWAAGLEASKYFARWDLNGSLSYANNDDTETDGWGADIGASLFATDNVRFDGTIGYADIDAGPAGDDSALVYGIGAEFGLGSLPLSLALNYSHAELDETDLDIDAYTVALRFNFGSESLFDRDRHGASQANRTGILGGVL